MLIISAGSTFKDLPTDKLLVLARHLSRVTGHLTLKLLSTNFPGVGMKNVLFIIEKLLQSNHIKRTSKGFYEFVDLSAEMETGELEEELAILAEVKAEILQSLKIDSPQQNLNSNSCDGNVRTHRGGEETDGVRHSTLIVDQAEDETNPAPSFSQQTFQSNTSTSVRKKTPRRTESIDVAEEVISAKPNSKLGEIVEQTEDYVKQLKNNSFSVDSGTDCERNEIRRSLSMSSGRRGSEEFFDVEFERILNNCVRPAPSISSLVDQIENASLTNRNSTKASFENAEVTPSRRTPLADEQYSFRSRIYPKTPVSTNLKHYHRRQNSNQFHWSKPVSEDDVKDPRQALKNFCKLKNLKGPAYTTTYMPDDGVYFCLVLVGNTSFPSYPTKALSEKRAKIVAAENAVKGLGITERMLAEDARKQAPEA